MWRDGVMCLLTFLVQYTDHPASTLATTTTTTGEIIA